MRRSVVLEPRSRLVKEIGLITQADRRSVIRTIRYSVARFSFLIRPCVLVCCCVLAYPVRPAVYCRAVRRRKRGVGGAEETRTPDPLLAKEVLSQLSYGPSLAIGRWRFDVGG